ncbi:hypothetical protein [Sphingomonas paucimobilis]|uniref:hypothetical protein n=1 Tax=Sphingomonas paucimobilis TaxID=13689 RepID=UPI00064C214F|nr:hypothetical protein [Sphingomonas paucimobilis]
MIDGGIVMIVVGWLITIFPPVERLVSGRRAAVRPVAIGVVLREAYPPHSSPPTLIELVVAADAALLDDALLRGERGASNDPDHS